MNKSLRISILSHALSAWLLALLLLPQASWAVSAVAGSTISNVATVGYSMGAGAAAVVQPSIISNTASFVVAELIQPAITWQDALPVPVNTPGLNSVLTFLLTNAGNGQEVFALTRANAPAPIPATNYVPVNSVLYDPANSPAGAMFLESNGVPGFQPGLDAAYVAGVNDPNLAPNATQIIYILSDTPALVANGSKGDVALTASSKTVGAAGAAAGTALAGLGQGGSVAVVGKNRAQAVTLGSYLTSGLSVVVTKTILSVLDPNGGVLVMPGSIISYQIVAALTGAGVATGLVINDPLPANTTYVPASMTLAGVALTDAADADQGQFIAASNSVSVALGNLTSTALTGVNAVITLRAKIN
ncbi:MAG: hypothetical protein PXX73_05950 [Sideroxydans sp.]|nr:hypothetical protein [Sideroxydans sp.]